MYSESDDFLSDEFDEVEEDNQKLNIISQFASELIDFSSQYSSDRSISYSAVNICGRPSKFPNYGDFAESFTMRNYGPSTTKEYSPQDLPDIPFHDFIIVKFENFVLPHEIRIYETYNPGAVVRIYAYCCTVKKWLELYQSAPVPVEKKAREFCPPIKKIDLPTK